MTLQEVPLLTQVEIIALHHEAHMKRRLMDLGFVVGNIQRYAGIYCKRW